MSKYTIEQLQSPSDKDVVDILNLYKTIKHRNCSAAAYLDYINDFFISGAIGIFVARDEEGIKGFAQVEPPSRLYPKTGWLRFAASACGRATSEKVMTLAEQWLIDKGATSMKVVTSRTSKKWEKHYKLSVSNEYILEKELHNEPQAAVA